MSPRDGNARASCHPVKKRILAYNDELLKSNELKRNATLYRGSAYQEAKCKKLSEAADIKSDNSATTIDRDFVMLTPCKNYSFVKDLESLSPCGDALSTPTKVSVIKTTPTGRSVPVTEDRNRWNSALALIQLACSPPSKSSVANS